MIKKAMAHTGCKMSIYEPPNLFDHHCISLDDDTANSQLTVLSFGCGQDSFSVLLLLIFDDVFRKKYAPNKLLVLFADTGNEHPFTYDFRDRVVIPLCKEHNIEFVTITSEMGFHANTWNSLTDHWKHKRPTIGSMGYPKSCTHNLKLSPQFNYLGHRLAKEYNLPYGGKREYKAFAKEKGKIRFLVGIAKQEEKRVLNGTFYLRIKNRHLVGILKTVKGEEQFSYVDHNGTKRLLKVNYRGSDRYVILNKKVQKICFKYKAIYKEAWKNSSIITEYPLIDIGFDRTKCQEYINSLNFEIPFPSNCVFCPFSSGSHMEILWLYKNMPSRFYEWVELENKKLEFFKNSYNFVLNKLFKPTTEKKKKIEIDFFNEDSIHYLKEQLTYAVKKNLQITINCLNYKAPIKEIEDFVSSNKNVLKEKVKNLGVCARTHKDGSPFSLLDVLEEAKQRYPDVTLQELQRHKFSHGHCVESSY